MTNWLSTGAPFDGVIANNDESAIGAIQAMKASGIDMADVVVGGVDATQDALPGDAGGRSGRDRVPGRRRPGRGSLDAAVSSRSGEDVEQKVYIPFQLVTPGEHRRVPGQELTPPPASGRRPGAALL